MYCVWQVVKTPTIISNNPVFLKHESQHVRFNSTDRLLTWQPEPHHFESSNSVSAWKKLKETCTSNHILCTWDSHLVIITNLARFHINELPDNEMKYLRGGWHHYHKIWRKLWEEYSPAPLTVKTGVQRDDAIGCVLQTCSHKARSTMSSGPVEQVDVVSSSSPFVKPPRTPPPQKK